MIPRDYSEEDEGFNGTEKLFMVVASLIFITMSFAYLNDLSFKKIFFKGEDDPYSVPIGRITAMKGSVSRQRALEFEFRGIRAKEPLFPNDTLITGSDGSMTIQLDDGQKFDLGPNSLIKLSFDYDFSMLGVVQKAVVQVTAVEPVKVAPLKVASPAPMPKPKPDEPVHLSITNPVAGTKFNFSVDDYSAKKKVIPFSFSLDRAPSSDALPLSLKIFHLSTGTEVKTFAISQVESLQISRSAEISAAGAYRWEVQNALGKTLGEARFEVARNIAIFQTLDPTGSSNTVEGLATKKDYEGLTLRWQALRSVPAGNFTVRIFETSLDSPIKTETTPDTKLSIKGKSLDAIRVGKWNYRVEKSLGNGFLGVSNTATFGFEFLPPKLVSPENKAEFDTNRIAQSYGFIVLTWSKTNYTNAYYLELFSDQSPTPVLQKSVKDNVYSLQAPATGEYFWQVRALAGDTKSKPSEKRSFIVNN